MTTEISGVEYLKPDPLESKSRFLKMETITHCPKTKTINMRIGQVIHSQNVARTTG